MTFEEWLHSTECPIPAGTPMIINQETQMTMTFEEWVNEMDWKHPVSKLSAKSGWDAGYAEGRIAGLEESLRVWQQYRYWPEPALENALKTLMVRVIDDAIKEKKE